MIPKVIDYVVNNDLCTGCGTCVAACPSDSIKMGWNSQGFLIPEISLNCNSDSKCINVCPFNPISNGSTPNEDELSSIFLKNPLTLNDSKSIENKPNNRLKEISYNKKIGSFRNLYAGHSDLYRETSSSGGITSLVLQILIEKKIVDRIICVDEKNNQENFYSYRVINSIHEIKKSSTTKLSKSEEIERL